MVITKAHKIELGMMVFGIAATYTMKKYIYSSRNQKNR
jgi:hypothetical protein